METKTNYLEKMCPKCGSHIRIRKALNPDGNFKPGYFEVECADCKEVFEIYINADVDASTIVSGAKLLRRIYKH